MAGLDESCLYVVVLYNRKLLKMFDALHEVGQCMKWAHADSRRILAMQVIAPLPMSVLFPTPRMGRSIAAVEEI